MIANQVQTVRLTIRVVVMSSYMLSDIIRMILFFMSISLDAKVLLSLKKSIKSTPCATPPSKFDVFKFLV